MFKQIFLLSIVISVSQGCTHRDYGNGGTICVCSEQLGCDSLPLNISRVKGSVTSYRTTKSGHRFEREELQFVNKFSSISDASVQLNRNQNYQKIIGFGGAFTDATGINIASLSGELQDRLIRDYFEDDGLEYRLGRVPIGGTDFSTRPYTYDDDGQLDQTLSSFALQAEDFLYKIPYIKQAQKSSSHKLKFFASSWSPPAWMKANAAISKGYLKGVPGGRNYSLYAKYLVRFLKEYNRNNITLWGLTLQNEPQVSGYVNSPSTNAINSLLLLEWMERNFLKLDLGPELVRAGFEDMHVMVYEDSHCMPNVTTLTCLFDGFMLNYVTTILEDKVAAKYASGIAFHWYANTLGNIAPTLDQLASKFPDKFLLSTEACVQGGVSLGNWTNAEAYALDIMRDLNHHVGGWIDWNMALDLQGGPNYINNFVDAPIIVNATAAEYYKQPMYYALGHFSKFLVPNSVRIQHQLRFASPNISNDNLLVTTFVRPDNGTVLNVLNKNNFTVTLLLKDPERGLLPASLQPNSLQSFVWY